jgi:hypothetical protein
MRPLFVIFLVAVLAYLNSIPAGFTFDDQFGVVSMMLWPRGIQER